MQTYRLATTTIAGQPPASPSARGLTGAAFHPYRYQPVGKSMRKSVEFFFDVGSPAAYLAWTQLPRLAADTGATILWRPMLLGGVFKATGNHSPVAIPAKGRWLINDLKRWADRYGVPLQLPADFPLNTLTLMRGAAGIQLRQPQDLARYLEAVFNGIFAQGLPMGDPAVVAEVLTKANVDPAHLLALAADPEVKQALVATTEEAVARGVFGAPSMFVGEEMHFGQDRLEFVAAALLG
jgi:2-hydroxychromene-2-carboxylate isomerase